MDKLDHEIYKNMKIGLLGGSFNPAHHGHREISLHAIKRLKLDFVWWLVTPQNPLKSAKDLKPLKERVAQAKILSNHPRIKVLDIEAKLKTNYTIDTLTKLTAQNQQIQFVWLMGADNLRDFHKWKNWQGISRLVPIAVVDRPTASLKALSSRAALTLHRINENNSEKLAPNAYIFLHGVKNGISSTAIRNMY